MTTPISKKQTNGYKSDILGQVSIQLKELNVTSMPVREFSTGSVGFNHSGKATIKCGPDRYSFQVSLNVTLAHSKDGDPKRVKDEVRASFLALPPHSLADLKLNDALAEARTFNSGKVGFYFNGKALVGGHLCQVGCSITAIGSEDWADERPIERSASVATE
jgi:hypothetical protein